MYRLTDRRRRGLTQPAIFRHFPVSGALKQEWRKTYRLSSRSILIHSIVLLSTKAQAGFWPTIEA